VLLAALTVESLLAARRGLPVAHVLTVIGRFVVGAAATGYPSVDWWTRPCPIALGRSFRRDGDPRRESSR